MSASIWEAGCCGLSLQSALMHCELQETRSRPGISAAVEAVTETTLLWIMPVIIDRSKVDCVSVINSRG